MFTDLLISISMFTLAFLIYKSINYNKTKGYIRQAIVFLLVLGAACVGDVEASSDTTIVFDGRDLTIYEVVDSVDSKDITREDVIELMNASQHVMFMTFVKEGNKHEQKLFIEYVRSTLTLVTKNRFTIYKK